MNRDLSLHLARVAAAAGVPRFVYVSTAKVHGEHTNKRDALVETAPPFPQDAYAKSKWAAEEALRDLGVEAGIEITAVRPPLVYGRGVGANFLRLLSLIRRRIPLPLASLRNARSLIGVRNLADFLVCCALDPRAGGKTFLVSDGIDLSTPDLVRMIAAAAGVRARLWPAPVALLRAAGVVTGYAAEISRLCGSFQVSIEYARVELGWTPPFSVNDEMLETVNRKSESTP